MPRRNKTNAGDPGADRSRKGNSWKILDLLEELADMITETALCGLGKSAALPVMSTLKSFP